MLTQQIFYLGQPTRSFNLEAAEEEDGEDAATEEEV